MQPGFRLWLVRHAQPLVAPGLCYGASDVPADAGATRQAAERLAQQAPAHALVWVSGLRRAQQLADALLQLRPDLGSPQVDARLNEIDFGCWELQAWDRIERASYDAWTADFARHRFGGRESVLELLTRVQQALADAHTQRGAGRELIWVTHAGVIRAVHYLASQPTGLPQASDWPQQAPAFGEWTTLDLKPLPSLQG